MLNIKQAFDILRCCSSVRKDIIVFALCCYFPDLE